MSVIELVDPEKAQKAPSLIYISYGKTNNYKKGDKVIATILGDIATSLPAQAKAKKIEIVN